MWGSSLRHLAGRQRQEPSLAAPSPHFSLPVIGSLVWTLPKIHSSFLAWQQHRDRASLLFLTFSEAVAQPNVRVKRRRATLTTSSHQETPWSPQRAGSPAAVESRAWWRVSTFHALLFPCSPRLGHLTFIIDFGLLRPAREPCPSGDLPGTGTGTWS
ncbi:hypothetical protein B0T25DRAFT_263411 [Lasiosphaeria hispida]|uniref:Uncharacterized protein n=1 Tax=Lasiosphaeria hispida TaxID=260671 RepID=A0AAJ0HGR5_9PEZI|nr:hypothetical protein B0T25DRAFT_263411 [Lasiosphaeria hispida]